MNQKRKAVSIVDSEMSKKRGRPPKGESINQKDSKDQIKKVKSSYDAKEIVIDSVDDESQSGFRRSRRSRPLESDKKMILLHPGDKISDRLTLTNNEVIELNALLDSNQDKKETVTKTNKN